MSDWPIAKLKELCERVTVGYVGAMADQYVASGVPFLRSLNIRPYRLSFDKMMFIDEAFDHRIKKSALRPGDVVIVRTGYPGVACVIPTSLPHSNCSDLVIVRPGKDLNPHFLCAIFNSTFGRDVVAGNLVGAAQQHFNITVAKELKLRVPKKQVQDKIAAALVAYHDLIENNRRRIALLERMAEQLYREWFVRFRFPGYQQAKFEKGRPATWRMCKLPELAHITYGFPFEGHRFNTAGIGKPIVRIRNVPIAGTADYTDQVADDRYLIRSGDLLIGMDGEFHMNHWHGEDAYLVQRVCRIKSKSEELRAYLYWALRAPIKHFEATIVGATVAHLGAKHLNSIELAVPEGRAREMLQPLNDLLGQKLTLACANDRLARTRDLLLPRLISGKLRVDDLDIQFPPSMQAQA